eukprot:gene12051-8303_t
MKDCVWPSRNQNYKGSPSKRQKNRYFLKIHHTITLPLRMLAMLTHCIHRGKKSTTTSLSQLCLLVATECER